jgi:hypothetical protein
MYRRVLRISFAAALIASASAVFAADEPSSQRSPDSTLFLTAQEPDMSKDPSNARLLVREIARQAVLMAGRDELGLSTRDMTLRETMPAAESTEKLDLQVTPSKESVRVTVSRGDQKFFEREIPATSAAGPFDYVRFSAALEELVASDLVAALQQAGFHGRANQTSASTEVPLQIEGWLREMNLFSQYSALRQLHALERKEGESPQTLAALARGYANLGQLTNLLWNASHKAYKARSLLYAQRLVKRDKGSAWSLQHRAYSEALVGLHAAALEDLKSAREQAGAKDQTAPSW